MATLDVNALYDNEERALWWGLRRRWAGADDAEIDDLAAEVWLRVWRYRESYRDVGVTPRAWLWRIAHNLLVDTLRWRRIRQHADVLALPAADVPRAPDAIAELVERDTVRAALDCLTPAQRVVIDRRFFRDERSCDVAAALGWTENVVRKHQHRALLRLRTQLAADVR